MGRFINDGENLQDGLFKLIEFVVAGKKVIYAGHKSVLEISISLKWPVISAYRKILKVLRAKRELYHC